ncbi:phosphatase PAP2 family protein [Carboxylicivirga linearis]|uniref:Phosphatase PAP2 family protein n=2 Tax=Carboxylicivirga linearis TaxID=1628157 RepID=A0ABS5JR10_9BACT|nr:phosphatase PAP2 family protein [Carboxylicivirga linearis]
MDNQNKHKIVLKPYLSAMKQMLLFVLVLFSLNSIAQVRPENSKRNYESDLIYYRKNVTKISAIVGASAVLAFALDESMQRFLQNNQNGFADGFANGANVFGEKMFIVPAVGLSWGAGYVFKDDKLRQTSWNAIKSIAVTAVSTEVIKISAGRARPFMDEGAYSFYPFDNEDHYKSLPSGHTSLAFAAFTPFAETYSRWLYVVPASVAFARIYKNKHWFSDVVIGGGLGLISGWIFTHHPKSKLQVASNGIIFYF